MDPGKACGMGKNGQDTMERNSPKSIFLMPVGAPFESDLTTSLLRIVDEAVNQGHEVMVWACGYATALTQDTLTDHRPEINLNPGGEDELKNYPSTAHIIGNLILNSNEKLRWCICEYCMRERGTVHQIAEVDIMPPVIMLTYMDQADISMVMGAS